MSGRHRYRDAAGLAALARYALYADAFMAAVAAAIGLVLGEEALLWGDYAEALAWTTGLVSIGSLILFLVWFYRANANARALGADDLMGSPGLSVGWFFIPIAALFMPYVVMRDTWKASAAPRDWQAQPTAPIIGFWWAAWLISNSTALIAFQISLSGDVEMMDALGVIDLISNLTAIPAAVLGALIVARVQWLQASPAHLSDRFS